jgi:hypothetical protein
LFQNKLLGNISLGSTPVGELQNSLLSAFPSNLDFKHPVVLQAVEQTMSNTVTRNYISNLLQRVSTRAGHHQA